MFLIRKRSREFSPQIFLPVKIACDVQKTKVLTSNHDTWIFGPPSKNLIWNGNVNTSLKSRMNLIFNQSQHKRWFKIVFSVSICQCTFIHVLILNSMKSDRIEKIKWRSYLENLSIYAIYRLKIVSFADSSIGKGK